MSDKPFGIYIRDLRAEAGFTLRDFCEKMHVDPGNWSRIERALFKPPIDKDFFSRLQALLKFNDSTLTVLMSLAKTARVIPKDEYVFGGIMQHLPVMFRRADGNEPSKKEVENLVDWLKRTVDDETSSED